VHTILFYDFVDDFIARRAPYRSEHLALIRDAFERGDLAMAGALADPVDGGVLVFRGMPQTAEAFAKADPYVIHGLTTDWRTRQWNVVVGDGVALP
jgi:uncharacterized protein YciI